MCRVPVIAHEDFSGAGQRERGEPVAVIGVHSAFTAATQQREVIDTDMIRTA